MLSVRVRIMVRFRAWVRVMLRVKVRLSVTIRVMVSIRVRHWGCGRVRVWLGLRLGFSFRVIFKNRFRIWLV